MKTFLYNIFLTFIWVTLTMRLDVANFLFGFILSYFILWFIQRKNKNEKYFYRIPKACNFMAYFIKEVIKGSLKIGYDIISPKYKQKMNPGIIAVPLEAKTDREITLLANSITLTPGTISIAVSKDRKYLYVYNVYINKDNKQISINEIKNGLEKKLLEAIR